jgi:hypothetical protein
VTQYEIRWANLPKLAGRRPVLLLSRADAYSCLNKFVVAEIVAAVGYALAWAELIDAREASR